jgi:hypothetical protein
LVQHLDERKKSTKENKTTATTVATIAGKAEGHRHLHICQSHELAFPLLERPNINVGLKHTATEIGKSTHLPVDIGLKCSILFG